MFGGRKIFFGVLVLGLLSCFEKKSTELAEKQSGQLVLSLNKLYVDTQGDNQPFFNGIEFVQQRGNKVLVNVDLTQITVAEAKKSLNRKGFKVEAQQLAQDGNSHKKTRKQGNSKLDIQIPEITFPNIFKALLVFYK